MKAYDVDASNSTAIFIGDVIKLEADGNVAPAAEGDLPGQAIAVVVGVKVNRAVAATEHPGYLPASTAGTVYGVSVLEDVLFEVEEDGAGGTMALTTSRSKNVDYDNVAGSTTTGKSGHVLKSSTVATTAALNCQLQDLADFIGNAAGTASGTAGATVWLVTFNESRWRAGTAGV
jgi:hypothetical protein